MLRTMIGGLISLSLLGLVGCSGGAGTDGTDSTSEALRKSPARHYLAIGDSIAFGDDLFIPWSDSSRDSPAQFVGYPIVLSDTPGYGGAEDLACPGETTGSFLSATATDNGCREYKGMHPQGLHVNYPGETQMQAALAFLAATPSVQLVTLNIGANDLLVIEHSCFANFAPYPNVTICIEAQVPGAIHQAAVNVGTIIGGIRQSGYTGQIVFLTQYSTNYNDPLQALALPALNGALGGVASQLGAAVADGYAAFQSLSAPDGGDPCKAGLLIPNPDGSGTCDIHPSAVGQSVLASTIIQKVIPW